MKKLMTIAAMLLTITACGSNNPTGVYKCSGPYKSLDFNNGKVIVDLGFIKNQGTYEVNGHNVVLTLDGKSIVFESVNDDNSSLKIKADDFFALTSPMIDCRSVEFLKAQKEEILKTPEGAEMMKTPEGRAFLNRFD